MRVLIVNTAERTGGAAIAANRLLHALNHNGVEARMLVRDRKTDDDAVVSIPQSWRLKTKFLWERGVIWLANGLVGEGNHQNLFRFYVLTLNQVTGPWRPRWLSFRHRRQQ